MVEFNHGRRKADYKNSSNSFDAYIDKLNQQHPDKRAEIFSNAYNYGNKTSVSEMRHEHNQEMHKEINNVLKTQKQHMRDLKEKQRDMRKGIPSDFIM